jgi:hypothetical protein
VQPGGGGCRDDLRHLWEKNYKEAAIFLEVSYTRDV